MQVSPGWLPLGTSKTLAESRGAAELRCFRAGPLYLASQRTILVRGQFRRSSGPFLADTVNIDLSTDLLMNGEAFAAGDGGAQWFFGALSNFDWVGGVNVSYSYEPRQPDAAVPEPAAWALMAIGFGLAGAALRRRPVIDAGSRARRFAPVR